VGKSTIFNKIVQQEIAQASNFPFCTIEPNIATIEVFDERVKELARISKSKKTVFSKLQCIDIAGLVKGASENVGLGNQFLENIRQVNLIIHVVRLFKDDDIQHINQKVDPVSDLELINTELILSDIEMCKKILNHKKSAILYSKTQLLATIKAADVLNQGILVSKSQDSFTQEEFKFLKYTLLTAKPMLYLANVDNESDLKSLRSIVTEEIIPLDPIHGEIQEILLASYKKLDLISFYTTGGDESRAWSVVKGSTARKASGQIHSDFEEKFIRASVISYEDFVVGRKNYRIEGAEYIIRDGDICEFRIGR
jgi:ribosome-binding ATPase YchF (GTP1/OBG family)